MFDRLNIDEKLTEQLKHVLQQLLPELENVCVAILESKYANAENDRVIVFDSGEDLNLFLQTLRENKISFGNYSTPITGNFPLDKHTYPILLIYQKSTLEKSIELANDNLSEKSTPVVTRSNVITESIYTIKPHPHGLLKHALLNELAEDIKTQRNIYQQQVDHPHLWTTQNKIDLWKDKIAMLDAALPFCTEEAESSEPLKTAEQGHKRWNDGSVAKALIQRLKSLLCIQQNWEDLEFIQDKGNRTQLSKKIIDKINIYNRRMLSLADDSSDYILLKKKVAVLKAANSVALYPGDQTLVQQLWEEEKKNPGWSKGQEAKNYVDNIKNHAGIPLDWQDYDPDQFETDKLTSDIKTRHTYYQGLLGKEKKAWPMWRNQNKITALQSKMTMLKLAENILSAKNPDQLLHELEMQKTSLKDWDKGIKTKGYMERLVKLKASGELTRKTGLTRKY